MNDAAGRSSSRNLLPTQKVGPGLSIWAYFTTVACEISTSASMLLGWRAVTRNTLRDFIDIELGLGLRICEAQVYVGSNLGTGKVEYEEQPQAGVWP